MSLVSVIVPTHDRVGYLEDAVESVLEQTHGDLECIVVDGGSTDGTGAFLDSVEDDRVRVVRRDEPKGLASARNAGLERATGDHVVFLDDDDRLYEDAVETLVGVVRDQPRACAGVYAAHRQVDERGGATTRPVPAGRVDGWAGARIRGPSCTLLRADVFEVVGPFDETFPAVEDSEFWIRLFAEYHMVGLDRALYERQIHGDQMTSDPALMLAGHRRLLDKHGDGLPARRRAGLYYGMAHCHARLDQLALARAHLRRAVQCYPWRLAFYYYHVWLLFGTRGYDVGASGHQRVYRPIAELLGTVRR